MPSYWSLVYKVRVMIRVVLLVKNIKLTDLEPAIAVAAEAAFSRATDPQGVPDASGDVGATLVSLVLSETDYATIQLYNVVEIALGKEPPAFATTEYAISQP